MKIVWLLLLTLSPLVFGGCQFKDIDKRFLVVAIGVDQSKNNKDHYDVTFKLAIPTGTPRMGQEEFQLVTVESESISQAMQKIKAEVDKELDFGFAKALLIGEKCAEHDVSHVVDWLTRQRFIQEIGWVAVAVPTAKSVLSVQPKFERLPSNALFLSFGNIGVESQYIVTETLFEFYRDSYEEGMNAVAPYVEKVSDHFKVDHAAVFDGHKIGCKLTDQQTRLFNILDRREEESDFIVETERNKYALHIETAGVRYDIKTVGTESCKIQVNIKMSGFLDERYNQNRITGRELAEAEHALQQKMNAESKTFLQTLQEKELDPIGFGLLYRANHWDEHAKEVRDWKRLYPKATFDVSTRVDLQSTGTVQ
jgi:spore germination protein KC